MALFGVLTLKGVALVLATCAAAAAGFFFATIVLGGDGPPPGNQISIPRTPSASTFIKLESDDEDFTTFPSAFRDFAIYWVGEEFAGHDLRKIIRQVVSPEDGLRPQNSVKLLYGSCGAENLTDGGCPYPLEIVIQPYCLVPPEIIGGGIRPTNIEKIRGHADQMNVGGGTRIWTGDVTVKVYASDPKIRESAISALVSSNGLGAAGTEENLPAPEAECSGYEMAPHPAEQSK